MNVFSRVPVSLMVYCFVVFLTAGGLSFASTPLVKLFAQKVGAIDVPKDGRRMHKVPIPRLGGLAIFFGFIFSVLLFGQIDEATRGMLFGAVIIVLLGVIDDITPLKAWLKLIVQILAAFVAIQHGIVIEVISNPNLFSGDLYLFLGNLSVPVTILWIVGITNAVNLIDGLDGLAVGVSSIACFSMFAIALLVSEPFVAVITAALAGACIGFMPYNLNPAKIFMGDTGATFLGYMLAVVSVQGFFKFYAILSFAVPFLILGLPIFDTSFAILRRLVHGKNPMAPDRGHVHHRLIDMGFNQKQSVAILYAMSGLLGLSAVVLTSSGELRALALILVIVVTALISIRLLGPMGHGADKTNGEAAPESTEGETAPADPPPAEENAPEADKEEKQ